ncbi:MAG TPA: hypothetical protein VK003_15775 [Oceanobacillus sp.]|nr:hypothetical protein [Oceanobacillus sp.]
MEDVNEQVKRASEAQQKYTDKLLNYPNVVGVGVGYVTRSGERTSEIGLIVMVEQKLPEAQLAPEDILPRELDGVKVDVQETGTFTA